MLPPVMASFAAAVAANRLTTHLSTNQDAVASLAFIGLLAALAMMYLSVCKRQFVQCVVDLLFGVIILSLLTPLFLVETTDSSFYLVELVHLSQLVLQLLLPGPRVFLLINVISLAMQLGLIWGRPVLRVEWITLVVSAVISFSYNFVIYVSIRGSRIAEARALVQERQATRMEVTIKNLLSVMCDAVVTLQHNLTLREPSPRLMTLMMRSGKPTNEMPSFLEYLSPQDVPRFQEFLDARNDLQARSIHVHLVDSVGTPVPVQLFHTMVSDCEDRPVHVLGIVEDGEGWDQFHGSSGPRMTRQRSGDSQVHSLAGSSNPRSSISVVGGLSSWGDIGKAKLTIRSRVDFEVLEESQPSRSLFGFGEGIKTSDNFFARFRNPFQLVRWLEFIHTIAARGITEHERMHYGEVLFRNHSSGLAYRADLQAVVKRGLEERQVGGTDFDFCSQMRTVDLELRFSQKKEEAAGRSSARSPRSSSVAEGPLGPSIQRL